MKTWLGAASAIGTIAMAAVMILSAQPKVSLDDDLRGWSIHGSDRPNFSVRDGVLRVEGPSGWLRSDQQYGDFILNLQVRFLTADADSSIFVRARTNSTFMRGWPNESYQVQLRVPTTPSPLPPLGGLFRHGMPAGETTLDNELLRRLFRGVNVWHDLSIEVEGDRLVVLLDGTEITRASNIQNSPGHIGIQGETGALEYRNLEIRPPS